MRAKTPQRAGSPPLDEIEQPGETCPFGAAFVVLQDMLALKYGQQIDENDFIGKAKARCTSADRWSPHLLVEALNAEPGLKVKDEQNDRLFQMQIDTTKVESFAELQGFVRRLTGTACAFGAITRGSAGRNMQFVAVFREAYSSEDTLVGKTRTTTLGRVGPLSSFTAHNFHAAVIMDPIIVRAVRYDADRNHMLDLQVPDVSPEFLTSQVRLRAQVDLASDICEILMQLAPGTQYSDEHSRGLVELVTRLMLSNPRVVSLQIATCTVLGHVLRQCRGTAALGTGTMAIEAVIGSMRRFASHPEVQKAACRALSRLPASLPELQSVAATNGAIEQTVCAMRRFPEDPALLSLACGALAGLSANHLMNQSVVAANHGIDVIFDSIGRFFDDEELLASAFGAFANLSAGNANNQAAIAAVGGLHQAMDILQQYSSNPYVLTSAIVALWCIIKNNPTNLSLANRHGAAELIVKAVQDHPEDNSLREMSSGALQSLIPGLGKAMEQSMSLG